jgi:hypothetical protein
MVMPECQKFAGTEVNRHSGETLALNVPADTFHTTFPSRHINIAMTWASSICSGLAPPHQVQHILRSSHFTAMPFHIHILILITLSFWRSERWRRGWRGGQLIPAAVPAIQKIKHLVSTYRNETYEYWFQISILNATASKLCAMWIVKDGPLFLQTCALIWIYVFYILTILHHISSQGKSIKLKIHPVSLLKERLRSTTIKRQWQSLDHPNTKYMLFKLAAF